MANEIQVECRLQITKNNLSTDTGRINFSADMAGDDAGDNTQVVPTTAGGTVVAIPASIGTVGVIVLQNLEAAGGNFVTFGTHDGSGNYFAFVKCLPGEAWIVRLGGNTLYALADTGSVRVRTRPVES